MDIEQIKKNKDGLDVISDIYIYAVLGEKASPEDLIRFKWYGIHKQEDTEDYFRLKVPLPLGQLNLEQLNTLLTISKKFAKDSLLFNTYQKVEFKWLRMHNLPEIFNLLQNVGLKTIFEAGHNVKNIITCPVNGIDKTQIADVSSIAAKLNETFIGNKNFSNLPNELTIAVSGYAQGCALTYTPDISFNATKNEKGKVVYSLRVIGEHLGFITSSQIIPTARAIAKIYKDFGIRDEIEDSTFQYLVGSWGFSKFFDILDSSVTFRIKDFDIDEEFVEGKAPRLGINESKIENQSYIGCKLKTLDIGSQKIEQLINLLEKYGASKVKLTHKANVIVLDAPTGKSQDFAKDLEAIEFNPFV